MSKRSHPLAPPTTAAGSDAKVHVNIQRLSQERLSFPSLGSSEFAATMHAAEDPLLMIRMLRKFVAIVKAQLRQAIGDSKGVDEDEDDGQLEGYFSDSDPVLDYGVASKRIKTERQEQDWMKDTKSYQVPFVGTSVAKGDCGRQVNVGTWPTGLLEAYLRISPRAVELLADNPALDDLRKRLRKRKEHGILYRLERCILHAISQIATALVTFSILKREILNMKDDYGDDENNKPVGHITRRFASLNTALLKSIPSFCKIISDINVDMPSSSPTLHVASKKNRAKTKDGTADLPPSQQRSLLLQPTLNLLRIASLTSCDASKAVFHQLIQLHTKSQTLDKLARCIFTLNDDSAVQFIDLVRSLVTNLVTESFKGNAFSVLRTKGGSSVTGAKPAGILYIALREGLQTLAGVQKIDDRVDEMADAMADLVEVIRTERHKHDQIISVSGSWDILQSASSIATKYPPPLELQGSGAYRAVLDGKDNENVGNDDDDEENIGIKRLGIECRRFLYRILWQSTSVDADLLGRIVFALSQSRHCNQAVRLFLLACVNRRPELWVSLMNTLTLPEETRSMEFVTYLTFVASLLRDGPSLSQVVNAASAFVPRSMIPLVPTKLQSHHWNRVLQKGNSLVVLKCLQLLCVALERFEQSAHIEHAQRWLPDIRIIIAIRLRFPVFNNSGGNPSLSGANTLVCDCMYRLIIKYARAFPAVTGTLDWSKWLPDSAGVFLQSKTLIQYRLLECLTMVAMDLDQNGSSKLSESCRVIADVMVKSQSPRIRALARNLVTRLLSMALGSESEDSNTDPEALFWVDAIADNGRVETFFQLLDDAIKHRVVYTAHAGLAWRCATKLPSIPVISFPILLTALAQISSGSEQRQELAPMTYRVLFQRLTYEQRPQLLAVLVTYFFKGDANQLDEIKVAFYRYCQHLLDEVSEPAGAAIIFLSKSIFPSHDFRRRLFDCVTAFNDSTGRMIEWKTVSHDECEWAVRLLFHLISLFGLPSSFGRNCSELIGPAMSSLFWTICNKSNDRMGQIIEGLAAVCLLPSECNCSLPINLMLSSMPRRNRTRSIENCIGLFIESIVGTNDSTIVSVLLGRSISSYHRVSILFGIIERFIDNPDVSSSRLLQYIIEHRLSDNALASGEDAKYERHTLDRAVRIWQSVAQRALESVNRDALLLSVVLILDSLLGSVLSKGNLKSTYIDGLISQVGSARTVVSFCLLPSLSGHSTKCYALGSIIKRDPIRYIPQLMAIFNEDTSGIVPCFNSGALDATICEAVGSIRRSKMKFDVGLLDQFLKIIAECLASRMATGDPALHASSLNILLGIVECGIPRELLTIFRDILLRIVDGGDNTMENHLQLLTKIIKALVMVRSGTFQKVVTLGFLQSCRILQRCFESLDNHVLGSLDATNENITKTLGCLLDLNDATDVFDSSVLGPKQILELFPDLLQQCIRHGIHYYGPTKNEKASELCIASARIFLKRASLAELNKFCNTLSVFDMVVNHSDFHDIMIRESIDASNIKVAVVSLLTECVELSSDPIRVRCNTWWSILSCFRAGLGDLDTAVRQLLCACYRSKGLVNAPPLEDIRWNSGKKSDFSQKSPWDWLLNNLDSSRVRATVYKFPLLDSIELAPTGADLSDHSKSSGNDKSQAERENQRFFDDNFDDNKQADIRYSPAFVLPLIVAALEDMYDDFLSAQDHMDVGAQTEYSPTMHYVTAIRRFCDNGVLALSLVSLASECKLVRALALSALHFLLVGLNTSEAKKDKLWRERPQLAMVTNSVQRALTLQTTEREKPEGVPRLSSLVAVFIAKSSLIISRPGDELFAQINRLFLSMEDDHGAFRDIDRLPGFMSLFCSSSDDTQQARKDRTWALQLLIDGCQNNSCYKLISSCHASELILTSFDNYHARVAAGHDGVAESRLHLEALTTILRRGGDLAHNHFAQRIGIVSWFCSVLIARPTSKLLPTTASVLSFFETVIAAIAPVANNGPRESSQLNFLELQNLAQSLISLFLDRVGSPPNPKDLSPLGLKLVFAICESIHLLGCALSLHANCKLVGYSSGSLSDVLVTDAVRLLKYAPKDLSHTLLLALCRLPCRLNVGDDASEFIHAAISDVTDTSTTGNPDQAILLRIHDLIEWNTSSGVSLDGQTLKLLLEGRPAFCCSSDCYARWISCCRLLIAAHEDSIMTEEVAVVRLILVP